MENQEIEDFIKQCLFTGSDVVQQELNDEDTTTCVNMLVEFIKKNRHNPIMVTTRLMDYTTAGLLGVLTKLLETNNWRE